MGWYGSAYLLTTASLQLPFGKLYTFLSIKRVFLAAIFIFELGSLVCGVARNSRTLILGRAIAGVGGAGIFTGAFTVLAYSVPLEKRPVYTGVISEFSFRWGCGGVRLRGCCADGRRQRLGSVERRGAAARWVLHRQGELEVVLFHQPSHRTSPPLLPLPPNPNPLHSTPFQENKTNTPRAP